MGIRSLRFRTSEVFFQILISLGKPSEGLFSLLAILSFPLFLIFLLRTRLRFLWFWSFFSSKIVITILFIFSVILFPFRLILTPLIRIPLFSHFFFLFQLFIIPIFITLIMQLFIGLSNFVKD